MTATTLAVDDLLASDLVLLDHLLASLPEGVESVPCRVGHEDHLAALWRLEAAGFIRFVLPVGHGMAGILSRPDVLEVRA